MSPRADKPILCLNCAGLAESLLESELFGYERGAFTGAVQAKQGLLETAHGGTVFLDEIGEMPLAVQGKLLRVIENHEVTRLGGLRPRPVEVRFVSATNRDLENEVLRGTFRRDLFFRLNGISLIIPPLRERIDEVPLFAKKFLADACADFGRKPEPIISARAMSYLKGYSWPGNIRELRNVIERAVVLCTGFEIGPEHLPLERMRPMGPVRGEDDASVAGALAGGLADVLDTPFLPPSGSGSEPPPPAPSNPAGSVLSAATASAAAPRNEQERSRIVEALAACAGNQSRAAKLLGIPRRTFVTKLEAYNIPRPQKHQ